MRTGGRLPERSFGYEAWSSLKRRPVRIIVVVNGIRCSVCEAHELSRGGDQKVQC
jgi:hypothetical protein